MSAEELSQTLSKINDHKYETNILIVNKNDETYTSPQYKIRIYLNDSQYDTCIAIGKKQKLNDFISFKYVYNVKYNEIHSILGVYEYKHNENDNIYKEGSLCLMDYYLNPFNLESLRQTKEEYLLSKQTKVVSNLTTIIKHLNKYNYDVSEKKTSIKPFIDYYKSIMNEPNDIKQLLIEILEMYKSNKMNDIFRIVDNLIETNESINKNKLLSMIFISTKEDILNLIERYDMIEIKENIKITNNAIVENAEPENDEQENSEPENSEPENAEQDNDEQDNDEQDNDEQDNDEPENAEPENAEPDNDEQDKDEQENNQPENEEPENEEPENDDEESSEQESSEESSQENAQSENDAEESSINSNQNNVSKKMKKPVGIKINKNITNK